LPVCGQNIGKNERSKVPLAFIFVDQGPTFIKNGYACPFAAKIMAKMKDEKYNWLSFSSTKGQLS
jgi:hypothetical protein